MCYFQMGIVRKGGGAKACFLMLYTSHEADLAKTIITACCFYVTSFHQIHHRFYIEKNVSMKESCLKHLTLVLYFDNFPLADKIDLHQVSFQNR